MIDFPSRQAAVFFVSGCSFRCRFCHNAALLTPKYKRLPWDRLERTCREFGRNWVNAAVVTGGEPTLWPDLVALLRFFRRIGWAVKLDTNGSDADMLRRCLPLVDYVAMDVKAGLSRYEELTGFADLGQVTASLQLVRDHAHDYEFRTTVVEPFHDDGQMREIGGMIRGARRYILQPFLPREGLPDPSFEALQRTRPERLEELRVLMGDYAREVRVRGE
jgi:pyruvate formate lyase activating enzyme